MTMGQKMKQLRKEKGLTMEDLATELNKYGAKLSKSKISLLENDKVSLNNRYIDYYVKFFKISYDWLKGKNKCIGQKLMKLRLDNNLKLDELVKIFNEKYNSKIDITTISKLEQNKLSANNKYLGYYADYFGVSYEWLQNDEQARHIVKNATIQSLMTYEKFKKEVKKLGFKYLVLIDMISVNNGFELMCTVEMNKRYNLYIHDDFYKLDESLQKKLFGLVTELAKTPLDERGKIK